MAKGEENREGGHEYARWGGETLMTTNVPAARSLVGKGKGDRDDDATDHLTPCADGGSVSGE